MNKKLLRNVSLVALSAVMVAGTATAFAGCGGDGSVSGNRDITVHIFCDATDSITNDRICQEWAAKYSDELRAKGVLGADEEDIKVTFGSTADTKQYFDNLNKRFSRGTAEDIIYVQPKLIKNWTSGGRIVNLADIINRQAEADKAESVKNFEGVWQDVLAFYGYSEEAGYSMGDKIGYFMNGEEIGSTGKTATEDGFYSLVNGVSVGLYGLPKDYSNFTLGYNARYFSDNLKLAYQTVRATDERNVKGAFDNPAKYNYAGGRSEDGVVTYAADGKYTVTVGDTTINMEAEAGENAPLINIGVPTTYKPYNFYAFPSLSAALQGGDPVAKAWNEFTGGKGYTVTMPGFPGETFEVPESMNAQKDPEAPYNNNIGHITFTYAEYSALTWAVTYFCNTYNFRAIDNTEKETFEVDKSDGEVRTKTHLSGTAGVTILNGTPENVFGNDQYEGAPNPTLYLLPWLAGNDANFINSASNLAVSAKNGTKVNYDGTAEDSEYDLTGGGISLDPTKVKYEAGAGGKVTEQVLKKRLNGNLENVDVQYGVNSERFIETFGAFLAYGSDWNGNSGNARAMDIQKPDNGWALFRNGACIFYGAGTWDSKTKNESPIYDVTSKGDGDTFCEFRSMTIPVSERYSLYSSVKDAYYESAYYYNGTRQETAGGTDVLKVYSKDEVIANQMTRQDKWGARMDSVGFAMNSRVLEQAEEDPQAAWKLEGCMSLIMELSTQQKPQHDLTLAGAQLPNFSQQCEDFLNYQQDKADGSGASDNTGSFSDMVTPEGFATTKYWDTPGLVKNADGVKEAKQIWNAYISVVEALEAASAESSSERNMTFTRWFSEKYPDGTIPGYTMSDGTNVPLRWDQEGYGDSTLAETLIGELGHRANSMKVLKMTTYTYADRDLMLRMQYGVNAIRDSAMYTYELDWINQISMRSGIALAYCIQVPTDGMLSANLLRDWTNTTLIRDYQTPAYFCMTNAEAVQGFLEDSIRHEADS